MPTELIAMAIIIGVPLLGWIGYEIWWHMKYKHVESPIMEDEGIVTDMDYTPPKSSTRYDPISKQFKTKTEPPKHVVCIKFRHMGKKRYDDVELYETVRMDDDVKAEYTEIYKVEKQNPRNKEFVRYSTKTITSPKGRTVKL